ncbi:hypothetical protein GCM10028784_36480 [Myceligenerans cantabricum]
MGARGPQVRDRVRLTDGKVGKIVAREVRNRRTVHYVVQFEDGSTRGVGPDEIAGGA